MAIYKTYDFTRILGVAKNPSPQGLSTALKDLTKIFKRIEKQFHEIEERLERLESSK
jgi:hypothetical protein